MSLIWLLLLLFKITATVVIIITVIIAIGSFGALKERVFPVCYNLGLPKSLYCYQMELRE